MTESIEPPMVITSEEHGIDVIAQTLSTLEITRKKAKDKPVIGMMYLKFNTEKDMDTWLKKFHIVVNAFWKEKCGVQEPLHIQAVSKENDLNTVDVLFADSQDRLRLLVQKRFPGLGKN